jgi:anaerobic magnesium-protoporphyrin IX monomethyl ester cyclase
MKKILFVIAEMFYSEPIGVMQLSAILKRHGHKTKLTILSENRFIKDVIQFEPDLIAYSTMSPDVGIFKMADSHLKDYLHKKNKQITRIMGGAHPTYFNYILEEMHLDAICVGEGDNAILEIVKRISQKSNNYSNIRNVISVGEKIFEKEIINDLDSLPFIDREIIYTAAPEYRDIAIRSILTSRGCPYRCTYCFNHSYNKLFKGVGKIVRRASVDRVINELKYVVKNWQPVKIIRFGDDTFVYREDNWLIKFAEEYKKEINIPFYCLMRSNTLSENIAQLLREAGCVSIGMSIETGDEQVRNNILNRNLPNEAVLKSFEIASKYGLKTYANCMLGIPGTRLKDDYLTVKFVKKLKVTVPTFAIFAPYPGTELTTYALENGLLDKIDEYPMLNNISMLKCYTKKEKIEQFRLSHLGTLYYFLPRFLNFSLKPLAKLKLTVFYNFIDSLLISYLLGAKIFFNPYPKNLKYILKHIWRTISYTMCIGKKTQSKTQ